jgi:hypothetical protein
MFSKKEWEELSYILLGWALKAYSIESHPLSTLSKHDSLSRSEFESLVLMTGLYLLPHLYGEQMKNKPNTEVDLNRICDDPEIRDSEIFKSIVKASITEIDSPRWKTLQDMLIYPMMDNLLFGQITNPDHPLHKLFLIIGTVSTRINLNEAANSEMNKEGSADYFHRNEIAGPMSRLTGKKVIRLKNSKQGKKGQPSPVNKFFSREINENGNLKAGDLIDRLEQYCEGDEDDEIGVVSCEGEVGKNEDGGKDDKRSFIYTDNKKKEITIEVKRLPSMISKLKKKMKKI